MNKFTLGAVTGASSLALAVPLLAGISFAQSSSPASTEAAERPVPTQACLNARIDLETAHLANIDDHIEQQKARMQARIDELKKVAAIADDDERAEALKQLREERPEVVKIEAPENVKTAMESVKAECGDVMMFRAAHHAGFGPMAGMRAMKIKRFGGEDMPVRLEKFEFDAAPADVEAVEEIIVE